MFSRRILLGSLAVVAAVATGCSDDNPPAGNGTTQDGAQVLRDASAAAKEINSAHFALKIDGEIPSLSVHNADGDLDKKNGAKGKVSMDLLGSLFEGEFVLVNETIYIKGPTGGFQQLPASMIANIYDPSAILDPDRGIAKVLASVQNPKAEGTETVNGTSTVKVSGRAGKDVVSALVPGVSSDVDITFWVREDNKQPVKASVRIPGSDGKTATAEVLLSDINKPVAIDAPK